MATWVSNGGEWHPAKERIALKNKSNTAIKYKGETIKPGDEFIYEDADREALKQLNQQDLTHLGHNFMDDNEFLEFVHQSRFKGDVDAYLKYIRYDPEKAKKEFEEKAKKVKSHEIPKRVQAINDLAGGRDFTGNRGNDVVGGFGEERLNPAHKG